MRPAIDWFAAVPTSTWVLAAITAIGLVGIGLFALDCWRGRYFGEAGDQSTELLVGGQTREARAHGVDEWMGDAERRDEIKDLEWLWEAPAIKTKHRRRTP